MDVLCLFAKSPQHLKLDIVSQHFYPRRTTNVIFCLAEPLDVEAKQCVIFRGTLGDCSRNSFTNQ
ncbi:hypothetical protein T09_11725 [Trichinella sp. T9]|nr:hypothetical protein T09_11725 [Trichinella sp. T9]